MYTWIFSTHVFYLKIFHNCSLPDVASGVIVLLDIISVVAAFCVVVGKDDEPNKVEFVLIHIHSEFTESSVLIFYNKEYFALFFISYISITCIHIYSSIFDISLNFFTYVTHGYFTHVYSMIKFFHSCSLLDVASAIIALLHIILLVVSL